MQSIIDTILNSDKEELATELKKLNAGMLNSFILHMKMCMKGLIEYKNQLLNSGQK